MRQVQTEPRHRAVIVGGFGGLAATRALRRAPVDVTVVDRQAHRLFQPLLYQVATGVLSDGDIASPLRDILRTQRNARVVVLAEVVSVDLERSTVARQQCVWSRPWAAVTSPALVPVDR